MRVDLFSQHIQTIEWKHFQPIMKIFFEDDNSFKNCLQNPTAIGYVK